MGGEAQTLDALLRAAPQADPAIVDGEHRITTSDVWSQVAALAAGLRARGVERGDVVAWQLPNWHESVVCHRACWQLGAVAVPLHHRAGAHEVQRWVEALAPKLILSAPNLPAAALPDTVDVRGDGGFEALLEAEPMLASNARPADRALVMFTSGSSADPKGVVHTHRSLTYKARTMVDVHGLTTGDVVLMPAPLAHVSGLLNGVLVPSAGGMKVVLMDHWDPAEALRMIEEERVSYMVGPPTFFHGLMDDPSFSSERVASLRVISCGGTGVTRDFVEQASERLGAFVKRSYGSTEAPTVATTHAGDPPERAATTDGRATGEVELRVTDADSGSELAAGSIGELWVRGPELFEGYLDPDQTAEVMVDGWFRTGDLARVDEQGWLTVVGRDRDVIIRAGENIAPGEVEAALEAHPSVRRAVAVGVPDGRVGEIVAAVVVADGAFDVDACQRWFAERGIARFKTPERVLCLTELPLLASGKPDRHALVAMFDEIQIVS